MIYLDHNASSPLRPEAFEAMRPWLARPVGNPSSAHAAGRRARRALEDARELIAQHLGAFADEVVFTSGATEANNLAIFGLAGIPPGRIISSRIEHPCVIAPLEHLAARGFQNSWLPVSSEAVIAPNWLLESLTDDTRLVAVMLANHETGAIQPVTELVYCACEAVFHCDAAQAVGKIPVNFHALGVTTLSVSAHKFGGPPAIGALLVNRCAKLTPVFFGGPQQHGRRPGTEPVALAVGMAAALDAALKQREAESARMFSHRERFLAALRDAAPVVLNGPESGGVPHVLNLSFPGCRGDALLMALDLAGVCCSTGSACSSGSLLPSPVLKAMGVPEEHLISALRFSFGYTTTQSDVDEAASHVIRVVSRQRQSDRAPAPVI
jgi:cysteine desulfurase